VCKLRRSGSDGFTLMELLVVLAIVAVLAASATFVTRHARIRTTEAAALAALKAITQAQFTYMQTCGNGRYAPTLVALGAAAPGNESGFISPDLAASDPLQKSGYRFELRGTEVLDASLTCTDLVPLETYRLTADPVSPGASGNRFFATNTDRVVYADGESFADDMPETGAPDHGEEIR